VINILIQGLKGMPDGVVVQYVQNRSVHLKGRRGGLYDIAEVDRSANVLEIAGDNRAEGSDSIASDRRIRLGR
jgi:hypothetical protein